CKANALAAELSAQRTCVKSLPEGHDHFLINFRNWSREFHIQAATIPIVIDAVANNAVAADHGAELYMSATDHHVNPIAVLLPVSVAPGSARIGVADGAVA